jgi:hypothetical protein
LKPPVIATGPQPGQRDESPSALAKFGMGGLAVSASGFIPTKSGRLWDKYLSGIRAAETAFPGAILRTFRISEFLSPLESWSKVSVPSEQFDIAGKYAEFLRHSFGSNISNVTLTRTSGIFGQVISGDEVVGLGLRIKAGTQKGAGIADYFARIGGTNLKLHESLNDALLRAEYNTSRPTLPYQDWLKAMEPSAKQRDLILGVKLRDKIKILGKDIPLSSQAQVRLAKGELLGQLLRAKAATTAGRLNTLLSKPFEYLPASIQKLPLIRTMAIKPGSALQMTGRYIRKGVLAMAAWKGLEYYDYVRSEGGPWATALGTMGGAGIGAFLFKGIGRRFSSVGMAAGAMAGLYTSIAPRFDYGLFHGLASIGTDLNVARAKASETIGLAESLREQERVTPGLISVKTAVGFAGAGALGAGFAQYGGLVSAGIKERLATHGKIADIFEKLRESRAENFGKRIWESRIGRKIMKLPGGSRLAKVKSPMVLGLFAGLGLWGLASSGLSLLSGNFGAAIPGINLLGTSETPEELQAIYSGQQEVPIRKGKFWEFGRSTGYSGGQIEYYRPHFIHRLKTRAFQKGLWGSEEERWAHDPWLHPLQAMFGSDEWKYYYETKYQYERPAPLTGTYGEDIPFVGPLVAATFGQILKPRKLVRPEEWIAGEGQYVHRPGPQDETEPAYELGGLPPGAPVSPEEGTQLLNELVYRRREAVGLVGFAEGAIHKAITGREETFANLQTMETMGGETGSEYWLWKHINLGGALGTCLPAGEKVLTPQGLKNIENITIDDVVYDHEFNKKHVLNVMERICSSYENMVTLNTICGNQFLRMTGNHPVAVFKRIPCKDNHNRPCTPNAKKHCKVCGLRDLDIHWEWINADKISANDFVVMPLPHTVSEGKLIIDFLDSLEYSNGETFTKDGFLYFQIRDVKLEPTGGTKVYDIEVEESHCFVGEYVLLHNSESVRRFTPRTRSYLETYNPLANTAPSWMPSDYYIDFKHGNTFKDIKEAETRLPGTGYAAYHPEVAGLSPEEYPLAHRVKILGDVAMWSEEYKTALSKAKKNIGLMSDHDRSIVLATEAQVEAKKTRREITDYRFRPELLTQQQVNVTEVLDPRHIKAAEFGNAVIELQGFGAIRNMSKAMEFAKDNLEGKKISIQMPTMESRRYDVGKNFSRVKAVAMMGSTDYGQILAQQELAQYSDLRDEFEQIRFTPKEKLAGRLSESLLHGMETPVEMLTPMSPVSKLIRQRSPIEEYIATEAIGTGNAFWDRPVENFLKPAANTALYQIGFNDIPDNIRQRRDINEYFDMLAWVKSKSAERVAQKANDWTTVKEEQAKQQETLFGLDVFGSPFKAMKAIPRRERDFYDAFSNAPTEEERATIMSLIPENEQRLYMANWLRQEEESAAAKKAAGIATAQDDQMLVATKLARKSEGFGITQDLEEQWMEETDGKVPFDDWIRNKKAEEYFATHSLPGADWLGWNVDLDDVKLKYVEMMGLDYHDFDLWDARKRSMARKPYIDERLINQMDRDANLNEVLITRANAKAIGKFYSKNARVDISEIAAPIDEQYNIDIVDGRKELIDSTYKYIGATT